MNIETPKGLFTRSERNDQRANQYGQRIDTFLGTGNHANDSGTDLGWNKPQTEIDRVLSQPRNTMIVFGVFGLGLAFIASSIVMTSSALFLVGIIPTLLAAIPTFYIFSNMRKASQISDTLLHHNLTKDMQQELTRNAIRSNFSTTELGIASIAADVSVKELESFLAAVMWASMADSNFVNSQAATASDIREKDYQLSRMDKERVLQEAIDRAKVAQTEAEGDVLVKRTRLERQLEADAAVEKLQAEERRWQREMTLLEAKDSMEIRRQRLNEVTQLRKVLVATHVELRKNPELRDKLSSLIDDVSTLQEMLSKLEPMTEAESNLAEVIDSKLLQFVYKRHGLDDERQSA